MFCVLVFGLNELCGMNNFGLESKPNKYIQRGNFIFMCANHGFIILIIYLLFWKLMVNIPIYSVN